MAGRRTLTNELELQVVREYLAGGVSPAVLARQYDIAPARVKARQKRHQ